MTRVRPDLLAGVGTEPDPRAACAFGFQPQLDFGLEWCEIGLLTRHAAGRAIAAIGGLAEHRFCAGASADDIGWLEARVRCCPFDAGANRRLTTEVAALEGPPGFGLRGLDFSCLSWFSPSPS